MDVTLDVNKIDKIFDNNPRLSSSVEDILSEIIVKIGLNNSDNFTRDVWEMSPTNDETKTQSYEGIIKILSDAEIDITTCIRETFSDSADWNKALFASSKNKWVLSVDTTIYRSTKNISGLTFDLTRDASSSVNKERLVKIFEKANYMLVLHGEKEDNEIEVYFASPSSRGGVSVRDTLITRIPFNDIEKNYTSAVTGSFKNTIVKTSGHNHGLIVLNGPPGTGKSYLIRSLISEVEERSAVVCTPPLYFLQNTDALLQVISEYPKSLIIFEDVGEVLAYDASVGYTSELSNLLNITDGLISALSDSLIVLTFNYDISKINPAVLRPGRCISKIEVGNLSFKQAKSLAGDLITEDREYALAEIYEKLGAKDEVLAVEEIAQETPKRSMGFSLPRREVSR